MVELDLEYPIEVDGQRVEKLRLRRPKVLDLELMDKVEGEVAKTVALVANLAEMTPKQVRELDAADFQKVSEVVADFLGAAPPSPAS